MITVGLDFGTHQTKVCIEDKQGAETHYKFQRFRNLNGQLQYTLPSVIYIDDDRMLHYGFAPKNRKCTVIRYFKQAVFRNHDSKNMKLWEAAFYTIWYLSFIIFELEEEYGQDFTIQMGAPTDSARLNDAKAIAVSLVVSAYRLVENVFENNKEKFLNCDYDTLMEQTEVVRYSDKLKDDFGLLVFPEAYACLKPMVGRGKVSTGMSLIIDIGGGTTDISFFTIENGQPQVYDFFSVDKGLNFLTGVDAKSPGTPPSNKIIPENTTVFYTEIVDLCNNLVERLKSEFKSQTELEVRRLTDALKNRPLIYTGGGSTYKEVLYRYNDFKELHTISYDNWKSKLFDDDALFRHTKIKEFDDFKDEEFAYVKLDGNIAVIGNGAGLTLTGMDLIEYYGEKPATFLDVGGGASEENITKAINLVLKNPNVKVIFLNVLGGITRADDVANAVVNVSKEAEHKVPIVIRLTGTNEEEGQRILTENNIPFETSMEKAAQKAVSIMQEL